MCGNCRNDRNRDLGSPRCYCVDSCYRLPFDEGLHQIVFLFPTTNENQSFGKLCQDLGRWRIAQVLISETSVNVSHMSIRTHSMRSAFAVRMGVTPWVFQRRIPHTGPYESALILVAFSGFVCKAASLASRACSCANPAVHFASREHPSLLKR